jgi:ATP-dependent Clp endopeptidase proteolytic subunit ClpP
MKPWYKITAKANKAKILIYEQIGETFFGEGVSAKKFINELDGLNVSSIDLHINSPGGNVFDGTSIYNALVAHDAVVNVIIDGIAASIASVIAMAGDTIEMPENSLLMIHDPSALVMGTAKDMEKMAEILGKIKGGMIKSYQTKLAMDDDEISEMMSSETWLTANEAAELGIVDKKTG